MGIFSTGTHYHFEVLGIWFRLLVTDHITITVRGKRGEGNGFHVLLFKDKSKLLFCYRAKQVKAFYSKWVIIERVKV